MAKTSGGVRASGRVRVGGYTRSSGEGIRNNNANGSSFIGSRNGNVRMKSADDLQAQINRIQAYTHKSGVSPTRFFKAVGRVSNAIRTGRRKASKNGSDVRFPTNTYLLKNKR